MSERTDGGPFIGDFRGEGEETEVFTGESWMPAPFAREALFSVYPANLRAMEADGRMDRYRAWIVAQVTDPVAANARALASMFPLPEPETKP